MNLQLTYYQSMILSMNRGRKNGITSNAKPLYLLTLINLIGNGKIIKNRIPFSDSIVSRYAELCAKFEPQKTITPMYRPFYHMNSEIFYSIEWKENGKPKGAANIPSSKFIRENIEYAKLDDDLWQLLQNEEARNEIKETIINYFIKPNKE